jgi:tetratricopeptide (TPR) repeat protein
MSSGCWVKLIVLFVAVIVAPGGIRAQADAPGSAALQAAPASPSENSKEAANLTAIEERLFSRSFDSDSIGKRLLRLEKFVFGDENKNALAQRIELLDQVFEMPKELSENTTEKIERTRGKEIFKKYGLLDKINSGINNYNKRRYHNAEDDFDEAAALAPGLPRVYVYLGITLLQLNQRRAAHDALEAAYELDPFGSYGRYAKEFLINLAGDDEIRRRGPKDDLETVRKTLDKINNQSSSEMGRQQRLAYAPNWRQWSWLYQMSSMRSHRDTIERVSNVQQSANNLKDLLTAKNLPGDAKLRAFGTTINARYYGDETANLAPFYIPPEAIPQLKAVAESINQHKEPVAQGTNAIKGNKKKIRNKKEHAH